MRFTGVIIYAAQRRFLCSGGRYIYILVVVPSDLPLRGAEIKDYILVSQPARQMSDRAQNLET